MNNQAQQPNSRLTAKAYVHDGIDKCHPEMFIAIQKNGDFNPNTDAGIRCRWDSDRRTVAFHTEIPDGRKARYDSPLWMSDKSEGTVFFRGMLKNEELMSMALNMLNMVHCAKEYCLANFGKITRHIGTSSKYEWTNLIYGLKCQMASLVDRELKEFWSDRKNYGPDEISIRTRADFVSSNLPSKASMLRGLRLGRYHNGLQFRSQEGVAIWNAMFQPKQEFMLKPNANETARPVAIASEIDSMFRICDASNLSGVVSGLAYRIVDAVVRNGQSYFQIRNGLGEKMYINSNRGELVAK